MPARNGGEPIIRVAGLTVGFGGDPVLENVGLDVKHGEILAIVGASGTGKSVLMRSILGLVKRQAGTIEAFGQPIGPLGPSVDIERRWGVLFQFGALFSALTVSQNVQVPMREFLHLPEPLMEDFARLKIELVGLKADDAAKYPAELSGGMIKRAALARALALDAEVLFLDEPTAGLDPIAASEFDTLIAALRDTLGLTVVMVTHDLDTLHAIVDRIAVIGERRVLVEGDLNAMRNFNHPWVRSYFGGARARAAFG
jgi:phospholipid/cholesterol/gamma-HCH transport system ATP-binding protein